MGVVTKVRFGNALQGPGQLRHVVDAQGPGIPLQTVGEPRDRRQLASFQSLLDGD